MSHQYQSMLCAKQFMLVLILVWFCVGNAGKGQKSAVPFRRARNEPKKE